MTGAPASRTGWKSGASSPSAAVRSGCVPGQGQPRTRTVGRQQHQLGDLRAQQPPGVVQHRLGHVVRTQGARGGLPEVVQQLQTGVPLVQVGVPAVGQEQGQAEDSEHGQRGHVHVHQQQGQHAEAGVADGRGRRGESQRPELRAGPVPSDDQVDRGVAHDVGSHHRDEHRGPAPRLGRARPTEQLQDGQRDDALRQPQREVHDQLDPGLPRVQQERRGLTQQAGGDQHPGVHEEQPEHQRHLAEQEAVGLVAELQVEHQQATHGEHGRQQQQRQMRAIRLARAGGSRNGTEGDGGQQHGSPTRPCARSRWPSRRDQLSRRDMSEETGIDRRARGPLTSHRRSWPSHAQVKNHPFGGVTPRRVRPMNRHCSCSARKDSDDPAPLDHVRRPRPLVGHGPGTRGRAERDLRDDRARGADRRLHHRAGGGRGTCGRPPTSRCSSSGTRPR